MVGLEDLDHPDAIQILLVIAGGRSPRSGIREKPQLHVIVNGALR